MKTTRTTVYTVLAVALLAGAVQADWNEGDYHKMHYPQLPDPNGWGVRGSFPIFLADSWQCSQTGPVSDIHIWGSWKQGQPGLINQIDVMILSDFLQEPYDTILDFNQILWQGSFGPGEFSLEPYGEGLQGWYDPKTEEAIPDDHSQFHQINIVDIAEPLAQLEGSIYWLGVIIELAPDNGAEWGWKTSLSDHFGDDAIWLEAANGGILKRLLGPSGESLDLAFVITPEPATLALLLLGGLTLLRRKRVGEIHYKLE